MALFSLMVVAMAAATPTDTSALTCPQIAALTAELTVQADKEDAATARRASQTRLAKGLLSGLASGALGAASAGLAGQASGLGALAAQQALSTASVTAAQALANPATSQAEAAPQGSAARKRLRELSAMSASQGC
jgi:hypothetical protein